MSPDPEQPRTPFTLDAAGAEAVDALLDADAHGLGHARFTALGGKVSALLGLLESVPAAESQQDRQLLIDVTLARVARCRDSEVAGTIGAAEESGPRLDDRSSQELDRLVSSGWERPAPGSLTSLLASLDAPPGDPAGSSSSRLIEATLARVQQAIDGATVRMRLPADEFAVRPRSRVRLWDVVAAAACVALVSAIIAPMLAGLRASSIESQCAMNMGRAGLGFSLFANDHQGALPSVESFERKREVVLHVTPRAVWWTVGQPAQSHSANLYTLVRGGYASPADLACPGNQRADTELAPSAEDWGTPESVSYGYQLFASTQPRWFSGETSLVLADKSPVIERARRGESIDATRSSPNHASRGQNTLWNDGAVRFLQHPVTDRGDNIWLPKPLERLPAPTLKGDERPASSTDAFIGS